MTDQATKRHCCDEETSAVESTVRSKPPIAPHDPDALAAGVGVPVFEEIYAKYFSFVWGCTRRMGIVESELEDVVQEVFIVIANRLRTLEQPESLRSWIYGIVRRTASTHHRAKRAKGSMVAASSLEREISYPQAPSPLELAEQSDQAKLLWSLLAKLDPPKREVFVLAELDEMTIPEIASAIEVPLNTVYSRLRAARRELEVVFARHQAQCGRRIGHG